MCPFFHINYPLFYTISSFFWSHILHTDIFFSRTCFAKDIFSSATSFVQCTSVKIFWYILSEDTNRSSGKRNWTWSFLTRICTLVWCFHRATHINSCRAERWGKFTVILLFSVQWMCGMSFNGNVHDLALPTVTCSELYFVINRYSYFPTHIDFFINTSSMWLIL